MALTGFAGANHLVRLALRPRTVLVAQAAIVALLTIATLAGQYAKLVLGHDFVFGLVNLFDVDGERNLPTWYQSSSLLVASALLAVIAAGARAARLPFAAHWAGLSLIFLFLSADEGAFIHELTNPVLQRLPLPAFLYYSWVVFGAIFAVIVAAVYARFVLALARRTRALFILAGAVFVTGALGVEMIGASTLVTRQAVTFAYAAQAALEEAMEMTGVLLFTYALLDYIERVFGGMTLAVGRPVASIQVPRDEERPSE